MPPLSSFLRLCIVFCLCAAAGLTCAARPSAEESLEAVAARHFAAGAYADAVRSQADAVRGYKRLLGTDNYSYASALNRLSGYMAHAGDYRAAIRCARVVHSIMSSVVGPRSVDAAAALGNLSMYCAASGDFEEGLQAGRRAVDILEDMGENAPGLATVLGNMAACEKGAGRYVEALRLDTRALDIVRSTAGEESIDAARILNNISVVHHLLGDNDAALERARRACRIIREVAGESHPFYATAVSNLFAVLLSVGSVDEQIRACEDALRAASAWPEISADRAVLYNNVADAFLNAGNPARALVYAEKARDIRLALHSGAHTDILSSSLAVGRCHEAMKDYEAAEAAYIRTVADARARLGLSHPLTAKAADCLLGLYFRRGLYDKAVPLLAELFPAVRDNLRRSFASMGLKEQADVMAGVQILFSDNIPALAVRSADPRLPELAYDAALLHKGLLLNTERELKSMLTAAADTAALATLSSITAARSRIAAMQDGQVIAAPSVLDSLRSAVAALEDSLRRTCRAYGDYTAPMQVSWTDVRRALSPGDAAIEFMSFSPAPGERFYLAAVLTPDAPAPRIVPLFSDSDLRYADIYGSDLMYSALWSPLEPLLKGVRRIFFAADAELHAIAVEYVPDASGSTMAGRYDICRLSSTRELVRPLRAPASGSAVLFGGLDFDADPPASPESPAASSRFPASLLAVSFLPGTLDEVLRIGRTLAEAGVKPEIHTGPYGTEQRFKAMSGAPVSLLHIATHGFYVSAAELSSAPAGAVSEDRALTRSGLLLSGANGSINSRSVAEGADDGILTAREISRLDLHSASLVVLSACQTALGDISGEGVFGLQRGFKKAGAGAILMSLWEVADDATAVLMSSFYSGLVAGLAPRSALAAAQTALRTFRAPDGTTPYDDPYYWAAFILLDSR